MQKFWPKYIINGSEFVCSFGRYTVLDWDSDIQTFKIWEKIKNLMHNLWYLFFLKSRLIRDLCNKSEPWRIRVDQWDDLSCVLALKRGFPWGSGHLLLKCLFRSLSLFYTLTNFVCAAIFATVLYQIWPLEALNLKTLHYVMLLIKNIPCALLYSLIFLYLVIFSPSKLS